jgi:hypothetical protein
MGRHRTDSLRDAEKSLLFLGLAKGVSPTTDQAQAPTIASVVALLKFSERLQPYDRSRTSIGHRKLLLFLLLHLGLA